MIQKRDTSVRFHGLSCGNIVQDYSNQSEGVARVVIYSHTGALKWN
jgi:hypothetical protein